MKYPLYAVCTLAIVLSSATLANAQTTSDQAAPQNPPPSTGAEAGPAPATAKAAPAPASPSPAVEGATMQTIVVTANLDETVMPNDTPVSSVFGNDMTVQDTPRSVTELTPEILKAYDVTNLQDLSKTSPNAYQTDQFGGYSVPDIRGQQAEVFINGQQRTTRSDGPPTSFNSIESADVVEGPASSVYGPTQYTGGYVNFVTKQPYFDAWHSATSFTYGSYDTKRWQEDFGAPIIPGVLAFRASYEGEDSGSYYNRIETKSQDGFFALAYTPSKDFRVDFNTELQVVRFNENTGFNRPTQDLIDNHDYGAGAAGVAPTSVERISDTTTLISPQDSDYAKDYNAQLTMTYNVNDNVTIINRSYYEYEYLRNTELAQYYANLITSNNVQDRFEVHIDFDTPVGDAAKSDSKEMKESRDSKDMKMMHDVAQQFDFKHSIITGFAFKYIGLNDYQGFFNEALNATDLTSGAFPLVGNGNPGAFDSLPIPGTNLYGSPGGNYGAGVNQPGTVNENAYEASYFFQHNITFTPQWSMLYGVRGDLIFDDIVDPLPPTAGSPAFPFSVFTPKGAPAVSDNTVQVLGSANVSVDYKPANWITNYLTFSFNQSDQGNTGGGYSTFTPANNVSGDAYHLKNYLYEGGSKLDLMNHSLFLSGAGFYQSHAAVTALGGITEIRTLGGELQQTYQPNKNFYLSFNESYLHATLIDPTAEFTESPNDIFGGNGTPNFIKPANGHYRESGLPEVLLNGIASYKLDNGFGASVSYQVTDPIPTSEIDPVWIPWQYEIDASLFYTQKNYEARINFFNVTDQHNFSTGGFIAGTGNDLITIREPFHMEGTVSYKF